MQRNNDMSRHILLISHTLAAAREKGLEGSIKVNCFWKSRNGIIVQ